MGFFIVIPIKDIRTNANTCSTADTKILVNIQFNSYFNSSSKVFAVIIAMNDLNILLAKLLLGLFYIISRENKEVKQHFFSLSHYGKIRPR